MFFPEESQQNADEICIFMSFHMAVPLSILLDVFHHRCGCQESNTRVIAKVSSSRVVKPHGWTLTAQEKPKNKHGDCCNSMWIACY